MHDHEAQQREADAGDAGGDDPLLTQAVGSYEHDGDIEDGDGRIQGVNVSMTKIAQASSAAMAGRSRLPLPDAASAGRACPGPSVPTVTHHEATTDPKGSSDRARSALCRKRRTSQDAADGPLKQQGDR